jgi:hypothetical protein
MNYLNYITKREYINIYIILIYFFSILFLFIIKFSIPHYAKFFTFITILIMFLIVFFNLLFKKNIEFNKNILLLFLALIVAEYVSTDNNIYQLVLKKNSCLELKINFICKYYNYIYLFYAFLVSIILYNYKKINFENIFIFTSLIFSIFGFLYSTFFLLYSQFASFNDYLHLTDRLNFPPKMHRVFFHFSVTYLNSTRNYELFIILIGQIFIVKKIFNNLEFNKKKFLNYIIFSFFSIFIFFSYAKSIWFLEIIFFITLFLFFLKKRRYLSELVKLILIKIFAIIVFILILFYIFNFSDLIKYDQEKYKSNIFYYTAARITSLFSSKLTDHLYYKNKDLWFYYIDGANKKSLEEFEILKETNQFEFYKENKLNEKLKDNFDSTYQRLDIYKDGLKYFIKKPMGYGVGNIPVHEGNPESGVLYVMLTYGMLGIILYSYWIFIILKELKLKISNNINREQNIFEYIFFIIFILSQLFNSYFDYIFFWFFVGYFISKVNITKKITIQKRIKKIL